MTRYASEPSNAEKSAKARGSHVRVSFKNTRETAMAVRGMKVNKALRYLKDCADHKQIIPFRRFKGDVGRKAQCKQHKGGAVQGRWPKNAIKLVTEILKNAHSNALSKGLESDSLTISNVQ